MLGNLCELAIQYCSGAASPDGLSSLRIPIISPIQGLLKALGWGLGFRV